MYFCAFHNGSNYYDAKTKNLASYFPTLPKIFPKIDMFLSNMNDLKKCDMWHG